MADNGSLTTELRCVPPIGLGTRMLLEAIGACCPDTPPIIAGGFLRDRVFGMTASDIDIFVGPDFDAPMFEATNEVIIRELSISDSRHHEYMEGPTGGFIDIIYTMDMDSTDIPWPVQIIKTKKPMSPHEHMARFDWDICRFWTDGLFFHGPRNLQAIQNTKVATLRSDPDYSGTIISMERARRWQRDNGYYAWEFRDSTGRLILPAHKTSSLKHNVFEEHP